MSLNHKRRIFRSAARSGRSAPPLGVWLAAAGGGVTLLIVASLFVGPSEAPARAPVSSQISAGPDQVAVVDGDTLRVGEHVIRLAGIIAPARGSVCLADGQASRDCGSAAANAVAELLRGKAVTCTILGHDGQGRPAGTCLAGATPLSDEMVREGWAHAAAAELSGAEAQARAAGRGIWQNRS